MQTVAQRTFLTGLYEAKILNRTFLNNFSILNHRKRWSINDKSISSLINFPVSALQRVSHATCWIQKFIQLLFKHVPVSCLNLLKGESSWDNEVCFYHQDRNIFSFQHTTVIQKSMGSSYTMDCYFKRNCVYPRNLNFLENFSKDTQISSFV